MEHRRTELSVIKEWVLYWRKFMPQIGARKLYKLIKPKLVEHGIKLGRDGFFTYLRSEGLLVKPKKSYIKTTFSKHWMKKHPNLLKEGGLHNAEHVLVSDITYLESDQGVHYLSLVTDSGSISFVLQYSKTASMCVMDFSCAIFSISSENVFVFCISTPYKKCGINHDPTRTY